MRKPSRQDARLDSLLLFALEQLDAEDTARFVQSPDPEISAPDAQRTDRAFWAAMNASSRPENQNTFSYGGGYVQPELHPMEVKTHE